MNATRKRGRRSKSDMVYTVSEYSSNDGMLTSVWGPGMWHYMHTMSFNYPVKPTKENKRDYRDFILNLKHVLPCGKCRANLHKNFKRLPLTMKEMKSRDTFSRYIYDLHELVNKMLKKKSGLSYCDVRERYEHFRARCTSEKPKLFDIKTYKNTTQKNKKNGEKGCTEPLYGKKSKCIIKIVPQEEKCKTMQIDQKCMKKRN